MLDATARAAALCAALDDALAYLKLGSLEESLEGFAHCLAIEEGMRWRDWAASADLEHQIAMCLHEMKQFGAAIRWYDRCIATIHAK